MGLLQHAPIPRQHDHPRHAVLGPGVSGNLEPGQAGAVDQNRFGAGDGSADRNNLLGALEEGGACKRGASG
jgi:hypothetical protein